MRIKEYVSPIVTKEKKTEFVEFETLEELFNLCFVKKWSEVNKFFRYSISYAETPKLIAEFNGGRMSIIIGFLDGDISSVNLPIWENAA